MMQRSGGDGYIGRLSSASYSNLRSLWFVRRCVSSLLRREFSGRLAVILLRAIGAVVGLIDHCQRSIGAFEIE